MTLAPCYMIVHMYALKCGDIPPRWVQRLHVLLRDARARPRTHAPRARCYWYSYAYALGRLGILCIDRSTQPGPSRGD